MGWTEERVAELKRLWGLGKSTAEIGKVIGMTKNAVVGKAHRLGLEGRPSPIKRVESAEKTSKVVESNIVVDVPESGTSMSDVPKKSTEVILDEFEKVEEAGKEAMSVEAETASVPSPILDDNSGQETETSEGGVSLVDLTMHSCRWPIGDPKDANFHFCGKEAMLGKPYCSEHQAVAFVGIIKH